MVGSRAAGLARTPMKIKPIAAPRLYQRIAEEIARLIDQGTFKPGARLPAERDLARQMQVSRSSLREALSALELGGRVEIRLGSGVYVLAGRKTDAVQPVLSEVSPFDVLRARRLVESEAAALAARHATPAQIDSMRAAFTRLAADLRARRKISPADREFHLGIARASGNSALALVIDRLWEERTFALDARMDQLFVIHDRTRDRIGEHRAILDAIRARDPTAARRAMRRHLTNIERQRMLILRGGA